VREGDADCRSGRPQAARQEAEERVEEKSQDVAIDQIQLILAEKRTSLSLLRTGIAVFTLPLSVLTILIATSRHYNIFDILALFIPLLVICVGLVFLGIYLIIKSSRSIRHYDMVIGKLKQQSELLKNIVE
jgi:uncharacterized membrane protein YidH (DUF202 family)